MGNQTPACEANQAYRGCTGVDLVSYLDEPERTFRGKNEEHHYDIR
jgi:hypothetical protein